MGSKIRQRERVRNIRAIDKSRVMAERLKNAYISTKDCVEKQKNDADSPDSYASERIKTAAVKAAKKSAEASRSAVRTSKAAALKATETAKTVAKAVAKAVKSAAAALKSLVALLAEGGSVAVAIIIIVCLAAVLVGSVFGIFFSDDSGNGSDLKITDVTASLNREFNNKIVQIQNSFDYDTLEIVSPTGFAEVPDWQTILAVYAVKAKVDSDEVVTIDDEKAGVLKSVFWSMVSISYTTATINDDMLLLRITIIEKSADEMANVYSFSAEQRKQLAELMRDEYTAMFYSLVK